jgi:hypothetical protein
MSTRPCVFTALTPVRSKCGLPERTRNFGIRGVRFRAGIVWPTILLYEKIGSSGHFLSEVSGNDFIIIDPLFEFEKMTKLARYESF